MAVIQLVPRLLLSPVTGAVVDRFSRRTLIFGGLLFQAVCSASVAVLDGAGWLEIWMLYVAGGLLSIGFELGRTAEQAVIPVMFGARRVQATAALATVFTGTLVAGPLLAGLLLGTISYGQILWLNAVSYLGPIVMCIWSRIPHERDLQRMRSPGAVLETIREGLTFLGSRPALRRLALMSAMAGLGAGGVQTVVIFFVKDGLDATDSFAGIVVATGAAGMFVGSLAAARLNRHGRAKVLLGSACTALAGLLAFQIARTETLLLAQFVFSTGWFAWLITQDILVQDLVPNAMMGRVAGLMRAISHATLPASAVLLALVAESAGVRGALILSAGLMAGVAVLARKGAPAVVQFQHREAEQ